MTAKMEAEIVMKSRKAIGVKGIAVRARIIARRR
jgi:hypothetical protein